MNNPSIVESFSSKKYAEISINSNVPEDKELVAALIDLLGPDIWRKNERLNFTKAQEYADTASILISLDHSDKAILRLNTQETLPCDYNFASKNDLLIVGNLYAGRPNDFSKEAYQIINLSPLSLLAIEAEKFQWEYQNT